MPKKRKRIIYAFTAIASLFIAALLLNWTAPGWIYRTVVSLERWRAGLSLKSLTIGEHRIAYLEGGQGVAMILVHGYNGDKDNWTRMARYLTSGYRVIIPDHAGFGQSSFLQQGDYTIAQQARRLIKLADLLEIRKFHIAGNSMGGEIAGHIALQAPDRVLSLGLFNAAGITSGKKSEFRKALAQGRNTLVVHRPEQFRKMMQLVFVDPPFITDSMAMYLGQRNLQRTAKNVYIMRQLRQREHKLERNLPQIKTPSLVLWGDQDRIIDVSHAYIFHKRLPQSKLVVMDHCGHVPMLERPGETAAHYLDFLANKPK